MNTLISVITLLFVEILVKTSPPSARAGRSRTDPMLLVGSTTSEPPSSRATGIMACATTACQCLAKIAIIQYGLVPEGASSLELPNMVGHQQAQRLALLWIGIEFYVGRGAQSGLSSYSKQT
jgi:hypothetical protein